MPEQNDQQTQDQQLKASASESESTQHKSPTSDKPLPPPPPASEPVAQPQSSAPVEPAAQQPTQPAEHPEVTQPQESFSQQPQPKQPSSDQQPTFRENGAFSFFATPSDPDDDPAPMSWGFKIGWFVLGLIGGMLGLLMAWISTSTLSPKRRRQAVMWTWGGFAVQAAIFLIIVLNGGSFPFLPTGASTAAQSAGTAATGSASAFG